LAANEGMAGAKGIAGAADSKFEQLQAQKRQQKL
jgi:hypothetical protein